MSCLYMTCSAAARSVAPIRSLHVILKSYCGCTGVSQTHALTNQALDLHIAAVHAVYYIVENV